MISTNVSHETLRDLEIYVSELLKWNRRINLIGRGTTENVMSRHIEDSVQLFDITAPGNGLWCDLGSGGGLPALVVAIRAKTTPLEVVCVESDARKCAFLSHITRLLDLNTRIVHDRIEQAAPICANLLSARALAPLAGLLAFAARHGADGAVCLFPKGERFNGEIDEARREWRFSLETIPSRTSLTSAILKVRDIARAEPS